MNEQHLTKFLEGKEIWNQWRSKHPEIRPDLSHAVLNRLATKSNLDRKNSIFKNFQKRYYQGVDLHNADLHGAKIGLIDLSNADLRNTDLTGAEIRLSH